MVTHDDDDDDDCCSCCWIFLLPTLLFRRICSSKHDTTQHSMEFENGRFNTTSVVQELASSKTGIGTAESDDDDDDDANELEFDDENDDDVFDSIHTVRSTEHIDMMVHAILGMTNTSIPDKLEEIPLLDCSLLSMLLTTTCNMLFLTHVYIASGIYDMVVGGTIDRNACCG